MEYKIKAFIESENQNYIITINDSVYEMDSNANQPNGLNMYCGESLQLPAKQLNEVKLNKLPKGVLFAIIERIGQDFHIRFIM